MDLAKYEKRILVASMGTSAAVLTETLYSLIADRPKDSAFVPTEIVVVTTAVGKRNLERKLMNPIGRTSPYQELDTQLRQLDRLHAPLVRPRIVVPTRGDGDEDFGIEIEDAHAQADLDALADALLTEVQKATSDPSSVMILSLSGGKKGMSHIAGQVMSLCGRPQDQLVHIAAIPAGLERCESFYFPSANRYGDDQYTWKRDDGTEDGCSSAEVRLELAQQSYLPLRNLVSKAFSTEQFEGLEFTAIVSRLRQQLSPTKPKELTMTLSINRRTVAATMATEGGLVRSNEVKLGPQQFAYLWQMATAQLREAGVKRPASHQDACEILSKQERLEGDGWDTTQRASRAAAWFGNEGPINASQRKLTAFEPSAIQEQFHCKENDIVPRRKKLQNELAAKCNKAIADLLMSWMDVNHADFRIPVGRKGPAQGVSEHRLPEVWQIQFLEE